jgi:hypothetical protein
VSLPPQPNSTDTATAQAVRRREESGVRLFMGAPTRSFRVESDEAALIGCWSGPPTLQRVQARPQWSHHRLQMCNTSKCIGVLSSVTWRASSIAVGAGFVRLSWQFVPTCKCCSSRRSR